MKLSKWVIGGRPDAQSGLRTQRKHWFLPLRKQRRNSPGLELPAVQPERSPAIANLGDWQPGARVGIDDACLSSNALAKANCEHIARYPKVLDRPRQRKRVRGDDAPIAPEVDK